MKYYENQSSSGSQSIDSDNKSGKQKKIYQVQSKIKSLSPIRKYNFEIIDEIFDKEFDTFEQFINIELDKIDKKINKSQLSKSNSRSRSKPANDSIEEEKKPQFKRKHDEYSVVASDFRSY